MEELLAKAKDLPIPQRIKLVEDIWDSIAADPGRVRMTPVQEEELRRRLNYYDKHPEETVSWDEVQTRTLKRIGR